MLESSKDEKEYYPILDIVKFWLALVIIFHHYQQSILGDYRFVLTNFLDGAICGGYACEFLNCYIYRNLSMLLFGIIVTAFATVMYFAVERRVSLKIRNVEKNTTK